MADSPDRGTHSRAWLERLRDAAQQVAAGLEGHDAPNLRHLHDDVRALIERLSSRLDELDEEQA